MQFWGQWILLNVSGCDPAFLGQTYWNGTTWGPVFMNNWPADGSAARIS